MTTLIQFTIAAALILSIIVPFGYFSWERKIKNATKNHWESTVSSSSEPF